VLFRSLEADKLTPEALSGWMAREIPPLRVNGRIDLNGLDRLPGLAAEALGLARLATQLTQVMPSAVRAVVPQSEQTAGTLPYSGAPVWIPHEHVSPNLGWLRHE